MVARCDAGREGRERAERGAAGGRRRGFPAKATAGGFLQNRHKIGIL
jgi:hypothetical protein